MDVKELLTKRLLESVTILITGSREELVGQGHKLSGNLLNSFTHSIEFVGDAIKADIFVNDYGLILDAGVKPNRVPFNRGSGAKVSKYISGLIDFWQKRGLNTLQAKRAAFAVAAKQKLEGMPTRDSYRFATNGRRLNWRRETLSATENKIKEALNFVRDFQSIIDQLITN